MSFLTLLRRVALTLLFTLLPAASGWACTPVFVRGQATTLRLNVGQLTVPADARPGTPLYHKSFAWNRLSDGGEQWIRCADDPHGFAVRGSDATDGLSNQSRRHWRSRIAARYRRLWRLS